MREALMRTLGLPLRVGSGTPKQPTGVLGLTQDGPSRASGRLCRERIFPDDQPSRSQF